MNPLTSSASLDVDRDNADAATRWREDFALGLPPRPALLSRSGWMALSR